MPENATSNGKSVYAILLMKDPLAVPFYERKQKNLQLATLTHCYFPRALNYSRAVIRAGIFERTREIVVADAYTNLASRNCAPDALALTNIHRSARFLFARFKHPPLILQSVTNR